MRAPNKQQIETNKNNTNEKHLNLSLIARNDSENLIWIWFTFIVVCNFSACVLQFLSNPVYFHAFCAVLHRSVCVLDDCDWFICAYGNELTNKRTFMLIFLCTRFAIGGNASFYKPFVHTCAKFTLSFVVEKLS